MATMTAVRVAAFLTVVALVWLALLAALLDNPDTQTQHSDETTNGPVNTPGAATPTSEALWPDPSSSPYSPSVSLAGSREPESKREVHHRRSRSRCKPSSTSGNS